MLRLWISYEKVILYFFVAMLFPLPSFEKKEIHFGVISFDMERKHAVRLLSEKCGKVALEGKVRVNIQASECKFASKPFDEDRNVGVTIFWASHF